MELSYQECYQKFLQSYGPFQNWPLPYVYMNWFSTLPEQYQTFYLHPNNYCYLYDWTRHVLRSEQQASKKLSRGQKRKLKKKTLEEEYNKEKALIGRWVEKERKDLVVGLQKIQEQERKAKQKKQKKLNYLIEIHKQVYKHHMKKKNAPQNPNKRVETKKAKKRLSVIKKIKEIFESRRQKSMKEKGKNQDKKQGEQQQSEITQREIKKIEQQEGEYVDMSDDQQDNKDASESPKKLPTVSFPIKEIQYTNIGKLAGKQYNQITLRQWVTNVPTQPLEQISLRLINRLAYKQAIKKVNNPQKARKLIVSGLKQCKRTLTTILENKKSKCLIVALNIERNNLVKGVDDEIQKCITLGQQLKIPVIHVSTRAKLGRAFTGKFGPRLSIISIVNWEGYQDYVDDLMEKWRQSCEEYDKLP